MKILMGRLLEMEVSVKFYVFCFCLGCLLDESTSSKNEKIWTPNNNILNKKNWIDPESKEKCNRVEFGEYNSAPIYIDKLTANEFVLPYSGELHLLDGGYLKIVDEKSKEKTNCLKLKELQQHDYLDTRNWLSDVAANPAVPDREKLPCKYDTISLPNGLYSAIDVNSLGGYHYVSSILTGNRSLTRPDSLDIDDSRLNVIQRKCVDPSGCLCNEDEEIYCSPSKKPDCLSPVRPLGFCQAICGAYTTFKPTPGFSLKSIEDGLKEYKDISTHASKVDDDLIQVVFSEKEYSGDSVYYAKEFYKKLQEGSKKFRISDLAGLKASGAKTSGSAVSVIVVFLTLLFVIAIFVYIFYVYGDRRWLSNLRFRPRTSFSLTSTYRARFNSREDESGLIFDTQSIAGSVLNLRQSFDNPMFSGASKAEEAVEKIDTSEAISAPEQKPTDTSQNDPLYDLKKLNGELHQEIGSEIAEMVEDIPNLNNFQTPLDSDFPPLIEVEEIEE